MARGLRMTRSRLKALIKKTAKSRGTRAATPALPKGPNQTERMFNLRFLDGKGLFEPNTFEITGFGSRYTPDFGIKVNKYCFDTEMYIEVKGQYRSKKDEKLICERSRLAWEIAVEKNPQYIWVWAKKNGMAFDIKVAAPYYTCNIRSGTVRTKEEFENLIYTL